MAEELEFLVKNPSRPSQPDFRLRLPAAASVRQLKEALQAGYPGSPEPSAVTVSGQGWGWVGMGGTATEGGYPSIRLPSPCTSAPALLTVLLPPAPAYGRPSTRGGCSRMTERSWATLLCR